MDMVIGSSRHTVEVLQKSIFDKRDQRTNQKIGALELRPDLKLAVMFEGLNTEVFYQTSKIDPEVNKKLNTIKQDFCFLFVGHWLQGDLGQDRKDVGMLVRAFSEAFKQMPKKYQPALILKTSGHGYSISDRTVVRGKIEKITNDIPGKPPIYLLHGDLSDVQMNSLYNHPKVKTMITFTKGEGFGRSLLEFGVTGKPIMASNWSGHTDFLNPVGTLLLPGELAPTHKSVHNDWFIPEAKWFTVNYPYAINAMQGMHKHYDSYKEKAAEQKKTVEENFTLEQMQQGLVKLLSTVKAVKQVKLDLPTLQLPKLPTKKKDEVQANA